MDSSISGIGQICLTVTSIDNALPFYKDLLGGTVLAVPSPTLAFVQFDDIRVMLMAQSGGSQPPANSLVYFRATDIEDTFDDIVERGGFPERAPEKVANLGDQEIWMAFLRDPDGSIIGLMEERPQ